ncbi:MAG: hypothetical protein QHC90_05490 [Shinella sp.]|nr:hypothetical protein [Shinella sp.]
MEIERVKRVGRIFSAPRFGAPLKFADDLGEALAMNRGIGKVSKALSKNMR